LFANKRRSRTYTYLRVLRGESHQHGVSASAQCVPYGQFVFKGPIAIVPLGG